MGLTEELSDKLNELKREVMRRYKHQKYEELTEKIKQTNKRDKKTLMLLNTEIQVLKYNSSLDKVNILSLPEIESKTKILMEELQERGDNLLNEDGESSMLCEFTMNNLINFLKHFEIEINFDEFSNDSNNNNNNNNELKEEIEKNKETIKSLKERCYFLDNTLKSKVYYF